MLGLRYGIEGQPPLTLTEAGRELGGVSGARVGQLQNRALRILRRYTGNKVNAILGRDRETDPTPPYSRRIRRIDTL